MSIPITKDGVYAMAIKLSKMECVLKKENLHVPKRTRQRAKKFDVSVNLAFEAVVEKCVQIKGENWLCKPLRQSFIEMHKSPQKYLSKLISFELWEGDQLVAGEIGFVMGLMYTSLTGFYLVKGTGTIQLCATGQLLREAGILWWDFEMAHKYKLELGAHEIPRQEWVQIHHQYRDQEAVPGLGIRGERRNAQIVLDLFPSK